MVLELGCWGCLRGVLRLGDYILEWLVLSLFVCIAYGKERGLM